MNKLTAITICCNYSDFLIHSIKYNKEYFDEWIVVTDTKDFKTKQLCDENSISCIQTDIFYKGGEFRKFAAINEAIRSLVNPDWIVFIDGDIILSPFARRIMDKLPLNKDKIYGIDRLNCTGFERWVEYQKGNGVLLDNWLLHGSGLEWGARIVHIYGEQGENGLFTGWKPLGYFQLCHSSRITEYPEGSLDASHGDLAFAKLWDRKDREFIPEFIGIHLDTSAYKSHNWWGRKSIPFEYDPQITDTQKLWDRFVIWMQNLCKPDYYGELCFLCKIVNFVKNIFK